MMRTESANLEEKSVGGKCQQAKVLLDEHSIVAGLQVEQDSGLPPEMQQTLVAHYTGDVESIEAALNLAAVVAVPEGHLDLPQRHQNLA